MITVDQAFLKTILSHVPDLVIAVFDVDKTYRFIAGPALTHFGLTESDVVGKQIGDLVSVVHMEVMNDASARALVGQTVSFELETKGRFYECCVQPFREDGDIVGGMIVTRDISHRKRNDLQRDMLLRTDPMTGLLNRQRFDLLLRRSLTSFDTGAIAYIDLDGFKKLNDTRGHAEGDKCLKAVADVLQVAVRAGDYVARLGGDEFAVLFMNVDTDMMREIADRIRCAIFALPHGVSGSIGTARWPMNGTHPAELIAHAEAEMYREKRERR